MSPASTLITPALRSFLRLAAIGALLVLGLLLVAPAEAASPAGASVHASASVTIERPAVLRSERLFETNRWMDEAGENARAPANRLERACTEDDAPAHCRMVIYDLP